VPRVFQRGRKDAPGLALSRVLGDTMAQNIGVIHAPEILRCHLDFGQFVLLCTDGVWGYFHEHEAVELVAGFGCTGVHEGAAALVTEAKNRWLLATPEATDDITAVIAWL